MKLLERASRVGLDLLFPPQCALCGSGGSLLCDACGAELVPAGGDRCERCWARLQADGRCDDCRGREPAFVSLRAAFHLDDAARRVVHLLKYDHLTSLAEPMAVLLADRVSLDVGAAALLVPVPLHRSRRRTRGFNQAALLARHMGRARAVEVDERALRRVRATRPLSKTMHREERASLVRDAFRAEHARVDGRRVVLVDDVATTGATLDACATALRAAGAADVRAVTFARA